MARVENSYAFGKTLKTYGRSDIPKSHLSHSHCRHCRQRVSASDETITFVVEEEKRAVFQTAKNSAGRPFAEVWNVNRSADIKTEVILIITIALEASSVVVNRVGIKNFVSHDVVAFAVKFVGAGFQSKIDDAAGRVAEFRRVRVG